MSTKDTESLSTNKTQTLEMQALLLGRVERLLGSASSANPFPEGSALWQAFHEGWSRPRNEPVSRRRERRMITQEFG